MQTAEWALLVSGVSLAWNVFNGVFGLRKTLAEGKEKERAFQARWVFDIQPDMVKTGDLYRCARIRYKQNPTLPLTIHAVQHSVGSALDLVPSGVFHDVAEPPVNLLPQPREGSGRLQKEDLFQRTVPDAEAGGVFTEVWFFVTVLGNRRHEQDEPASFDVSVAYEENFAKRRQARIKLSSNNVPPTRKDIALLPP